MDIGDCIVTKSSTNSRTSCQKCMPSRSVGRPTFSKHLYITNEYKTWINVIYINEQLSLSISNDFFFCFLYTFTQYTYTQSFWYDNFLYRETKYLCVIYTRKILCFSCGSCIFRKSPFFFKQSLLDLVHMIVHLMYEYSPILSILSKYRQI